MSNKKVLLGSVSAVAITVLIGPALAQDAIETVIVTGTRASLQSAQTIKQEADQMVDSITAVDIGALPDRNVAEALQRVPGVTLQRNDAPNDLTRMGSTGNSVFVRGLSWVKTLVNGRDEFTAVDGRSLSFADVSADLMAGVDVYKNPSAKMIEGGVGGTVDLRTRHPFDQDGQVIAFSGDYTYGDLVDRALPSANALYSNRWETGIGEFGILASVDWQNQITRTEGINLTEYDCWDVVAGSYNKITDPTYAACAALPTGVTGKLTAPNGWAWRQLEFKQQRLASNLVVQWRPNDKWELTFNALNSYAHVLDMEHYAFNPLTATQVAAGNYDAEGRWLGGPSSTSSIDTRAGTGHNRNTDLSLDIKFAPTDALEISANVQFVESSSPYRNVTMFTGFNGAAPTFDIDVTGETPTIGWTDNSGGRLQDPASYFWLAAMDHLQYNSAHSTNARLDASYKFSGHGIFSLFRSVDAGFRTEQKIAVSRSTGYNWGATCPTGWGDPWSGCPLLDGTVASPYTAIDGGTVSSGSDAVSNLNGYAELFTYHPVFGNSVPSFWLPKASLAAMNTVDSYKLFAAVEPADAEAWFGVQNWSNWHSYASIAGCTGPDTTCIEAYKNLTGGASSGNRISTQREETYAGYLQVNYGLETFLGYDIPIDGNFGLRLVRTNDVVSDGKLVMPNMNQNSCVIGTVDANGNVTTDCSGFLAGIDFLGGLSGQGALVDRPGVSSGYTNYLPSFNFRARLSDELQARLAYSESLVRPDFAYTNSSATLQYNFYDANTYQSGIFRSNPSGYGGNPYLKPMRARNYDAGLEYYFAPTGSLTFSVFHKDLSDYIFTSTTRTAFIHPISGNTLDFDYTTYVNGEKGKVEGFELAYTQFYDSLPGWLSGFGVQANYTKIYNSGGHNGAADLTSTVAIANSGDQSLPLEGMSNDSYNLALMYEKYGIDARLAWNWRSTYLSSSSDSNTKLPVWLENYGQLDGSAFYSFWDHYKIGVQVTNILGASFYTDMGYSDYHPRTNWIKNDRKFAVIFRTSW
ncbi:MAG TPA: TonB-dependent receptor [Rhizomicrobium sp.]